MCFVDGFGGTTVHQTLEEIKVINNDIADQLKRIAVALETQVENQLKLNNKILNNLNYDTN
jgi:cytochrome c oxidase assembly protein Cox11